MNTALRARVRQESCGRSKLGLAGSCFGLSNKSPSLSGIGHCPRDTSHHSNENPHLRTPRNKKHGCWVKELKVERSIFFSIFMGFCHEANCKAPRANQHSTPYRSSCCDCHSSRAIDAAARETKPTGLPRVIAGPVSTVSGPQGSHVGTPTGRRLAKIALNQHSTPHRSSCFDCP